MVPREAQGRQRFNFDRRNSVIIVITITTTTHPV
jgi:hypothetical protein